MNYVKSFKFYIPVHIVVFVACFFIADFIVADLITTFTSFNIHILLADYWYCMVTFFILGAFIKVLADAQKPSYMPFATFVIERSLYKEIGNWGMIVLILLSLPILIGMAVCLSMYFDYTTEEIMVIFFFAEGIYCIGITGFNIGHRCFDFKRFNSSENELCNVCEKIINGNVIKLKWVDKWCRKAEPDETYKHYDCFIKSKPANIDNF